MGDTSSNDDNQTPPPEGLVDEDSTSKSFPLQAVGLIVSGVGFMGYGAFSVYKKSRLSKQDS